MVDRALHTTANGAAPERAHSASSTSGAGDVAFFHTWEILDSRTQMCGASAARFPGLRYVVLGFCLHERWGVVAQSEEGFRTRERAERAIKGRMAHAQAAQAEALVDALERAERPRA